MVHRKSGTEAPIILNISVSSSRETDSSLVWNDLYSELHACANKAATSFLAGWLSASYSGDTIARAVVILRGASAGSDSGNEVPNIGNPLFDSCFVTSS